MMRPEVQLYFFVNYSYSPRKRCKVTTLSQDPDYRICSKYLPPSVQYPRYLGLQQYHRQRCDYQRSIRHEHPYPIRWHLRDSEPDYRARQSNSDCDSQRKNNLLKRLRRLKYFN